MQLYTVHSKPNSLDTTIEHRFCQNLNGDYIGDEDITKFLCDKHEIEPELARDSHTVCSIGFSRKDQKWWGWSHRAICEFGIGSTVKKGDCAYVASTPEEMIDDYAEFFGDLGKKYEDEHRERCVIPPSRAGIIIFHPSWSEQFGNIPMVSAADFESVLTGKTDADAYSNLPPDFGRFVEFRPLGKGEWTAETFDDAKRMAIDFADSVK